MRFLVSVLSLALVPSAIAALAALEAAGSDYQPACAYPIGSGGKFAKVAGNVFDIDGRVGYFAGKYVKI